MSAAFTQTAQLQHRGERSCAEMEMERRAEETSITPREQMISINDDSPIILMQIRLHFRPREYPWIK